MLRNMKYGLIIAICVYILVAIGSFVMLKRLDLELIRMWGFGLSILLFLGSFPLYKTLYHAGRVANPTYTMYTPPDEHHQLKIQRDYESTKKRREGHVQGIFIWSACFTFLITVLLAVVF